MSKKYIIKEETKDFWGNKRYVVEESHNNFDPIPIILIYSIFGVLVFYKFLLYKIYKRNLKKKLINENIQLKIDRFSLILFILHILVFLPILIVGVNLFLIYFLLSIILTVFGIIISIKRKGNFDFSS
jgi:hypothetical protein